MDFVCRDADFGTQTVFKSVCKTCGGIEHDRRRIDFAQESFGMLKIVGNDGIRVVRTIRVDMVNGFFQGVNDLNRKYRSVVFFGPVGFCYVFNRTEIFQDGFRSLIAAKLHAFLEIDRADLRQERSGNFSVTSSVSMALQGE